MVKYSKKNQFEKISFRRNTKKRGGFFGMGDWSDEHKKESDDKGCTGADGAWSPKDGENDCEYSARCDEQTPFNVTKSPGVSARRAKCAAQRTGESIGEAGKSLTNTLRYATGNTDGNTDEGAGVQQEDVPVNVNYTGGKRRKRKTSKRKSKSKSKSKSNRKRKTSKKRGRR